MGIPSNQIKEVLGLMKALEPADRAYVRRWVELWVKADGNFAKRSLRGVESQAAMPPPSAKKPRSPYLPETPAAEADPWATLDARDFRPASIRRLLPRGNYDDK